MTELVERKGQSNAVMALLVVAFGLAAWRGKEGAPVLAAIFAVLAVATAAFGIYSARQVPSVLRISPDEITWSTARGVQTRIVRQHANQLRFRRNAKIGSPWLLTAAAGGGPISMDGFHPAAVGKACAEHGWDFETTAPFQW